MSETLKNVFKVTLEITMVEDSLWEVWERVNSLPHLKPYTKVHIEHIETFEPAMVETPPKDIVPLHIK